MTPVYVTLAMRGNRLYTGVTTALADGHNSGGKLLWFEKCRSWAQARRRSAAIRRWNRACKIAVIERANPGWEDLYAGP